MVRLEACCCVLLVAALVGLTDVHGFFVQPPDHHGYGVNSPYMRNFWNDFNTRIQHMEQAAHQSAAQLEGLLRRWIPAPPPLAQPPLRRAPPRVPDYEEPIESLQPPKPPKRRPTYDREPLGDYDDGEDHFFKEPSYEDEDEFGHGGFEAGFDGFGTGGLFHALGVPQVRIPKPWWQGPNVCVTRENVDEGNKKQPEDEKDDQNQQQKRAGRQMSSVSASTFIVGSGEGSYRVTTCQQTPSKYTCTTAVQENGVKKSEIVTHQCCHGYRRLRNANTCRKVKLNDLVSTARNMGAAMFAQTIEASGVDMNAMQQRNITLFAPSDEAMQGYNAHILEQNEVEVYLHARRRRELDEAVTTTEDESSIENEAPPVLANDLKDMVLSHMVPGMLDLREVVNEQILYTENSKKSSIRLNIYPGNPLASHGPTGPLMTANCVPVKADETAENGIVAVVDRVLLPVTRTLKELITDNPKLATFKKVLERSGEWETLGQSGHWTVFAPTEEAFERLPGDMLNRLLEGDACVDNVVRHHIAEYTLCSACVRGEVSSISMAGEPLRLSRGQGRVEGSEADEVHVESAAMVSSDVTATNGVLHLIDAVLMPKSARTLSQALADRGLSSLVRALGSRGLLEQVDAMRNVTFFAPSESVLRRAIKSDEESPSKDTLLYHIADGEVASCEFENNVTIPSHLSGAPLHINIFQTMPTFGIGPVRATVQCARVIHVDEAACGATLHEIDRMMTIPSGNILQTLEKTEGFTIILDLIKGTSYETRLAEDGAYISLLAPTDEALKRLTVEQLEKLREDKEFRELVLSKHILKDVLCCEGVATPNWPFTNHVRTDFGTSLPLTRGPSGELQVGPLPITKCDIMASNGVVHGVDAVRVNSGFNRRTVPKVDGISMNSRKNPNVEVKIFGL